MRFAGCVHGVAQLKYNGLHGVHLAVYVYHLKLAHIPGHRLRRAKPMVVVRSPWMSRGWGPMCQSESTRKPDTALPEPQVGHVSRPLGHGGSRAAG